MSNKIFHDPYSNEKDKGYQIVRYGNDLIRTLPLNQLNENELNLFMTICASLTRNSDSAFDYLSLNWFKELMGIGKNITNDELKQLFASTFKKLNANYIKIEKNEKSCIYFRMFESFGYDFNPKGKEFVFYKLSGTFKKFFCDLVKEFTTFYLLEMTSIKGIYAKRLFMLLKQFRKTDDPVDHGIWKTVDDWIELLGVPNGYAKYKLMNRIITPAVEELKTYNHFEDLIVKKTIVNKKLKAIGFYWTKEKENPKGMMLGLPHPREETFDEVEYSYLMEWFEKLITREEYEEKIRLHKLELQNKKLSIEEQNKTNPFKSPIKLYWFYIEIYLGKRGQTNKKYIELVQATTRNEAKKIFKSIHPDYKTYQFNKSYSIDEDIMKSIVKEKGYKTIYYKQ